MAAWTDLAACRGYRADLWFSDGETGKAAIPATEAATSICSGCPVRTACLAEAMRVEAGTGKSTRHGIWGGLTPGERYELATSTAGHQLNMQSRATFRPVGQGERCPDGDRRHGTSTGYGYGCRGVECTVAKVHALRGRPVGVR